MQNELIAQGLSLMSLGMGVVFVFLTLLVLATGAMSKMITHYFPDPLPLTSTSSPPAPSDSSQTDPRILAAIKAAIAEHRARTTQR